MCFRAGVEGGGGVQASPAAHEHSGRGQPLLTSHPSPSAPHRPAPRDPLLDTAVERPVYMIDLDKNRRFHQCKLIMGHLHIVS